tara:strand:- start:16236 stop:16922 length:687 start_codon:yes stop_codon:yes gene_type:complete
MKKSIIVVLFALAISQTSAQEKLQSLVSVQGEGIVKVVPDQVSIRMSVETEGDDARQVKLSNDTTVDGVLKYLKGQGLDSKDIQTQYVNLSKNYDYSKKTYNYKATQTITVLVRDLKKYDTLVTGLLNQGINRIDGISFGAKNMEALKSQARIKAVENAKQKAEEYAGVLNQKIGKAVQISEASQAQMPSPGYRGALVNMEAGDASGETLALGEMSVKAEINVSFELF